MALAGKRAMIKATGESILSEGESFSTTDDLNYFIDDVDKDIWHAFADIVVYDDAIEVDEQEYTLNRLQGLISFDTAEVRNITADIFYLPSIVVGQAFEFAIDLSAENAEANTFGNTFIKREQTLKEASGGISKFEELNYEFFFDLLVDDIATVIEFFVDENEDYHIRVRALLESRETSADVEDLVETEIDFESTTDKERLCVAFG